MLGNCINLLSSQRAMTAITINLKPSVKLTDAQFYHLESFIMTAPILSQYDNH